MIKAHQEYEFIWVLPIGTNSHKARIAASKIKNMHIENWINQKELLSNFKLNVNYYDYLFRP